MQTVTATRLYGTAVARAWDRLHPRLTRRSAWTAELGALPVIEGTVIRYCAAYPGPLLLAWNQRAGLGRSDRTRSTARTSITIHKVVAMTAMIR